MRLPARVAGVAVTLATALLGSALAVASPPSSTPGAPAGAPADAAVPSAVGTEDVGEVVGVTPDVTITQISPQVLTPDEDLQVTVRLHNAGSEEIAEPVARMHVNRFRVVDREGVDAWMALGPQDHPGSVVDSEVLEEPLAPGAARHVTFTVPGRSLGFLDLPDTWGPRGLAVSLSDGPAVLDVDRSFVLWLSAETVPQTRISILAPLTGNPVDVPAWPVASGSGTEGEGADDAAPETAGEDADAADDGEATGAEPSSAGPLAGGATAAGSGTGVLGTEAIGPLVSAQGRLSSVLTATARFPHIAYAVDPAVVAASLAATDEAARAWADQLLGTLEGRDVFALPWADPDVAALARGEGAALLEGAVRLSEERSDDLLRRAVRSDLVWPAGGLQDAGTLEFVAAAGARTVVAAPTRLLPTPAYAEISPTGRTTLSTDDGNVVVLVPDGGLVTELAEPAGSSAATIAQRLLAETAVIAREPSTELRHLVVAMPRDWHPDPAVFTAQLEALETAPWADPTAVSGLLGALDPRVERVPLPETAPDPALLDAETVAELAERFAFAQDFAPVLQDSETFLAQQMAQLLTPTAIAWRADPGGRADLAARVIEEAEQRTVGLSVVTGSDVSFFATEGAIPVTVSNELLDDANVVVELRPSSGVLVANEVAEAVVAAGEQTTVRIPVRSVASGDVTIEVALLSPEGQLVAPTSSFHVRVRADWENVGTGIVAALLGVGLVAGIIRTVRRGKTSTRVDAADVPELARETGE